MMFVVPGAKPEVLVTSDASGKWGCAAYCGEEWFMLRWAGAISSQHITIKELVPIVIAAAVWGAAWKGKVVLAQCDNAAVVEIINHGSSKNPEAMQLTRCLAFIAARREFHIRATHIRGVDNILADALSRDNLALFHSLYPQASARPTAIPEAVLELLLLREPDWMSKHWTGQWTSILKTD